MEKEETGVASCSQGKQRGEIIAIKEPGVQMKGELGTESGPERPIDGIVLVHGKSVLARGICGCGGGLTKKSPL